MATESRPSTAATSKINLLSEVVDLDLDGNITLANGKQLKKDLVIVADGIRVRLPVFNTLRLCPSTNMMLVAFKDKVCSQGCWRERTSSSQGHRYRGVPILDSDGEAPER